MKYILIFVIFILSFFIIFFSCSEPTKPPVNNGPDTTSHDFSWTIDTIGTYGSYLKDVAIINENNIWAVGEIHTDETDRYDSLGVWQPPFNVVQWNGIKWNLIRTEALGYGYGENYSVFAFNENDIWVCSGIPKHWDGNNWKFYGSTEGYVGGFRITKVWGTSSTDLYLVGTNGNITHYDGQSWQRLESGTDLYIGDIWGAINPKTNEYEILVIASDQFQNNGMKVLKIENSSVIALPDSGLPWSLASIWFVQGRQYYLTGDGIFNTKDLYTSWQPVPNQPLIYKSRIRGNAVNDVIVVGGFGLVSHYNGSTWRQYMGTELPQFQGGYWAVAFDDAFLTAVGNVNDRGIILRGLRKK